MMLSSALIIVVALLLFMYVGLTVVVIKERRKNKAALGDQNNYLLQRKIRAHGNFAEISPLFVMALFALDLSNFQIYKSYEFYLVGGLGLLFLAGRFFHAYSMISHEKYDDQGQLTHNPIFRIWGMMLSMISMILIGALLVIGALVRAF